MKQKVTRKKSTTKKIIKRKKAVSKKSKPTKTACHQKKQGFVEFIKCFFKV